MEYSTVGGKVSYTFLITSLLASRLFNSLDRVLSVMPETSLATCPKRFGAADNENRMSIFHLPSSASSASLMDSIVLGQPPFVSIFVCLLVMRYYTTG